MNFQITEYCHHILEEYIEEGDICIDATAGNGGDTEFLCQKVGETGNVYAFDVQEMAIAHTRERLEKANLSTRAKLIHDGHEKMQTYVKEEVKAMMLRHARMQVECKGDYTGIREMRKHISWYTTGLPGSAKLRGRINSVESLEEMEALLREM